MPAEGWKAVSLPDEVYDFFYDIWEKRKKEFMAKYEVRSFSGWLIKILAEYVEREKEGTLPKSD